MSVLLYLVVTATNIHSAHAYPCMRIAATLHSLYLGRSAVSMIPISHIIMVLYIELNIFYVIRKSVTSVVTFARNKLNFGENC